MPSDQRCNLCANPETLGPDTEIVTVRSNIRKFADERFVVWRCGSCGSLHARDQVDLPHYYAHYPFHKQKADWMLRIVYHTFSRRLRRAGLRPDHRILDYGCGSGLLVDYLKSKGYAHAAGYDSFSTRFADPTVLSQRYDCIIAQDLVEHVEDPRGTLRRFHELAKPGSIILIGTPNAAGIDLSRPERHLHTLHQPFHTHMFSINALLEACRDLGWSLDRLYMTNYTNTLIPFFNINFGLHYARCHDDTLDLFFEAPRVNRKLLSFRSLYLALFGYFNAPTADITAIFRVG